MSLAAQHQIHGIQPVLPVADVAAATDWFCRVLGFSIDFSIGEPASYARVKLGDHSWGAPIYIHLTQTGDAVQPCGATRLHVGHDIDGLHAHALREGAQVLLPPTDQPWGLREIEIAAPGGHRLVLGAEIAHAAEPHAQPRAVIVCYRAKPGQEAALLNLVRTHVPRLQQLGLATDRAALILRAADGSLVEAFEWSSAQAIADAHNHPAVQAMWTEFSAACDIVKLGSLPETQQLFAEFNSVDC
jgi:uncharacterized glyoxalase superfamily protein PhnB